MKVWIDISNSPHVTFFKPIIEKLERTNEIIITARKHSQTTDLLEMFQLKYTLIGEHAGKSKLLKGIFFFRRMLQLYKFARSRGIDCAVTHQSPYSMLPAKWLGIKRRVFIFDNETAKLQNMLGIPFSTQAVCPEAIPFKKLFGRQLVKYPGLKESVYMKQAKVKPEGYVLMRPEPWSAAYYNAEKDILVPIIEKLCGHRKVVLIPRDDQQRKFYSKRFGNEITIPPKMMDAAELIGKSAIVIGAGGSMNREAVVLGVPVISTYQGKLLAVDRWLISKGLMNHSDNVDPTFVEKCIQNHKKANFDSALDRIVGLIE